MVEPDAPWQSPAAKDAPTPAVPEPVEERRFVAKGKGPVRALAVTLIAPIAVMLSRSITLPGVDPSVARQMLQGSGLDMSLLSAGAIGAGPILTAFVLVELAALLIPGWRRLRTGSDVERAHLTRVALLVAFILGLFQTWVLVRNMSTMEMTGVRMIEDPSTIMHVVRGALLMATTFGLYAVTRLIDARGLGNGFSAVLGSAALIELGVRFERFGKEMLIQGDGTPINLVMALVVLAIAAWFTRAFLLGRRPFKREAYHGILIPEPASGIAPVSTAATLLILPATISAAGIAIPGSDLLAPGTNAYAVVFGVVIAVLVIAFSAIFNQPDRIAPLYEGASNVDAQHAVRRAIVRTLVFFEVFSALRHALGTRLAGGLLAQLDMTAFIALVAVAIDLRQEWAARSESPDLVRVRSEHRPYAVRAAVLALEARGIAVFPRALHHRTALQFFGPYVPIDLFVPRTRRVEAEEILAERR